MVTWLNIQSIRFLISETFCIDTTIVVIFSEFESRLTASSTEIMSIQASVIVMSADSELSSGSALAACLLASQGQRYQQFCDAVRQ